MPVFESLEQTSLAIWVGESLYGYPFVLGMHAVGLAIVVGMSVVVNLRLLTVIEDLPTNSLATLVRYAWAGFAINALSGIALFTSQASFFVTSTPFLVKITLILCGVTSIAYIQRRIRSGSSVNKIAALASLLFWLGAIVAGRLIAYL